MFHKPTPAIRSPAFPVIELHPIQVGDQGQSSLQEVSHVLLVVRSKPCRSPIVTLALTIYIPFTLDCYDFPLSKQKKKRKKISKQDYSWRFLSVKSFDKAKAIVSLLALISMISCSFSRAQNMESPACRGDDLRSAELHRQNEKSQKT